MMDGDSILPETTLPARMKGESLESGSTSGTVTFDSCEEDDHFTIVFSEIVGCPGKWLDLPKNPQTRREFL